MGDAGRSMRMPARTLGPAAALLLAGCASAYGGLRPEAGIPALAARLGEAGEFPATTRLVDAGEAGGRRLRIAAEERGRGDRERLVVLVHGVFSDSRLWRFMVGRLAAEADVAALDLPGCGGSDVPPEGGEGPSACCPDRLARATLTAIRGLLRDRPRATRVTLVGHSLGTGVILRALGSPGLLRGFSDVVRRVDGVVLLSPVEFSYAKRDPIFDRLSTVSGVEIGLGNALGLLREKVAEAVRDGAGEPGLAPREEADRVREILTDPERRRAGQAMLRDAIPFDGDLRPDWARIESLVDDYRRVAVPVVIAAGARDDSVPCALAYKLRQQLPRAWLRVFPRTGHSLPTERPEECARLVLDFLADRAAEWEPYAESTVGPPPARAAAGLAAGPVHAGVSR